MHAALAYRRPTLCLQGGNGGNNHHLKVTCAACMDLSQTVFVYPDHYCRCQLMQHDCDKTISRVDDKIGPFLEGLSTAVSAGA